MFSSQNCCYKDKQDQITRLLLQALDCFPRKGPKTARSIRIVHRMLFEQSLSFFCRTDFFRFGPTKRNRRKRAFFFFSRIRIIMVGETSVDLVEEKLSERATKPA